MSLPLVLLTLADKIIEKLSRYSFSYFNITFFPDFSFCLFKSLILDEQDKLSSECF